MIPSTTLIALFVGFANVEPAAPAPSGPAQQTDRMT